MAGQMSAQKGMMSTLLYICVFCYVKTCDNMFFFHIFILDE